MKLGDFRFMTTTRGLAACLATLGVPLKAKVPLTNAYSPKRPVPSVPFGHPKWYHGKVTWHFEACSQTWRENGKEITPNKLTKAYHDQKAAAALEGNFKALDDAFAARDINQAAQAWLQIKAEMPYALAGFIKTAMDNHYNLLLPMLKAAYEQQKVTGLSPDVVTVDEGEGQIHTSTNPSETVKENML